MRLPVLALLLCGGCTDNGVEPRPMPNFDIASTAFYAQPWPGDQHLDEDGTISFDAFVRPSNVSLVETYIDAGEVQYGWGTNAPIYLTLDQPVDPTHLPTPAQSIEPGSALVLLDVDPDSPYRGERFPVIWRSSGEVTSYQPENLLAISTAPGFPLRPSTTYALLLTSDGFSVNPSFQEVFSPDHPHHALWEPTIAPIRRAGLRPRDIAGGSVFTTSDPLAEMSAIARFVQSRLASPDLEQPLEFIEEKERFTAYRGRYWSPVFTFGERPYFTTGGDFRFDTAGDPQIASWDDMRLSVCVPLGAQPPPSGWPVVIYQHGTGGAYRGACNSDSLLEVGGVLADTGFVSLGIDQPLHGPRNGGQLTSDLANFNILNPDSGRTNFRQGAADALYLARALARRPVTLQLPDGSPLPLDPEGVTFVGHSQGGLTGALAAPFWAGDVKASVISGAGGLLSITVVDRKDIFDFAALVAQVARFEVDEEVHELHPVLGVVQALVEPTDPINYAPYWFSQPLAFPGHTPSSVLVTNGTFDANTPYRGALAMAAAARLPPLPPRATSMPGIDLRGLENTPSPASMNAESFDGPLTSGFSQWFEGSHFVIFEEPRAAELYRNYLLSSVNGTTPTLDLPVATPAWAGGEP